MNLSVVIITKNEEKNIARCIESVKGLVNDIVVVDSMSTDKTEEICRYFPNVRFVQKEWAGYSAQKNFGNSLAKNDIIFSLDADEALTQELKEEISNLKIEEKSAYMLRRRTHYCGQWIRFSGWQRDNPLRIFNRREGQWDSRTVHERVEFQSEVKCIKLNSSLNHFSFQTLRHHVDKMVHYADLASQQNRNRSLGYLIIQSIFSPLFRFIKHYLIKLGFIDGFRGFCISVITAMGNFLKYALAVYHRGDY